VNTESHPQLAAFNGRIILPFTLLRRLECGLEPTEADVLCASEEHQAKSEISCEDWSSLNAQAHQPARD